MAEQFTRPGAPAPEVPDMGHFRSVDVDHARSVLNRFYYPISVGTPLRARPASGLTFK